MRRQHVKTLVIPALVPALLIAGIFFILSFTSLYWGNMWIVDATEVIETIDEFNIRKGPQATTLAAFGAILLFGLLLSCLISRQRARHQLQANQKLLMKSQPQALTGLSLASIAHDYNNVLQSMNFIAERLRGLMDQPPEASSATSPDPLLSEVERLLKGLDSLTQLAHQMRHVGEQNSFGEKSFVNLRELTREVAGLLSYQLDTRGVQVKIMDSLGESPEPYLSYPVLIQQMLINLVLNASEAVLEQQGLIEVHLIKAPDSFLVEVHDNGPGIGEVEKEQVFAPFKSSKGQGRGLGLFSVKMCAEAHNGSVSLGRSPLGGACFRVSLPKES